MRVTSGGTGGSRILPVSVPCSRVWRLHALQSDRTRPPGTGGMHTGGTRGTPNAINLRLFVSHCHSALYGASASEGLLAQWCDLNSLQQEATDGQYSYGVGCA
jgi:hypothetical protein